MISKPGISFCKATPLQSLGQRTKTCAHAPHTRLLPINVCHSTLIAQAHLSAETHPVHVQLQTPIMLTTTATP
jgi:hypothetical protein